MLIKDQAFRIAIDSVKSVGSADQISSTDILKNAGITEPTDIDLLVQQMARRIGNIGYRIDESNFIGVVNPDCRVIDLVQVISNYSLPGDESFDEPVGLTEDAALPGREDFEEFNK